MTEILHENILTVSIKVIDEPVVVSPVRNPPEVIRFPLKIYVPLSLLQPILPLSPPHFPPPLPPQLPPQPLPLLALPMSTLYLVS